jgi:hypothetical protein
MSFISSSGPCNLPARRTVPAIVIFDNPFPAHGPDPPSDPWQPRATIAFPLGHLNRSWLSVAPGRATFLPFFVRLTQLPPRYPSYFYLWSVVRIVSRLPTFNTITQPPSCIVSSHARLHDQNSSTRRNLDNDFFRHLQLTVYAFGVCAWRSAFVLFNHPSNSNMDCPAVYWTTSFHGLERNRSHRESFRRRATGAAYRPPDDIGGSVGPCE